MSSNDHQQVSWYDPISTPRGIPLKNKPHGYVPKLPIRHAGYQIYYYVEKYYSILIILKM